MMNYTKENSVAFTGHRFVPYAQRVIINYRLKGGIRNAYRLGIRNFYCGMAVGFDMMAAECVLALKAELKDIKLIAVVPFRGQEARFSASDKLHYHQLLGKADKVVVLSEKYFKGCLLRRNDFMLENSSRLIAYYNGDEKGGTFYTCRRAEGRGMPILNLF